MALEQHPQKLEIGLNSNHASATKRSICSPLGGLSENAVLNKKNKEEILLKDTGTGMID